MVMDKSRVASPGFSNQRVVIDLIGGVPNQHQFDDLYYKDLLLINGKQIQIENPI